MWLSGGRLSCCIVVLIGKREINYVHAARGICITGTGHEHAVCMLCQWRGALHSAEEYLAGWQLVHL